MRTALGLDRVHVLGQSCGTVAASYGAAQPEGLAGLVLASPHIDIPQWYGDAVNWRRNLPEDIRGPLNRHEAAGTTDSEEYMEAVGKFANHHFCRLGPWPEDILKSLEIMNAEQFETMWGPADIHCTGTLRNHDGSSELHKIAAPPFTSAAYSTKPRREPVAVTPMSRPTRGSRCCPTPRMLLITNSESCSWMRSRAF